jgi:putative transposase
MRDWFTAEELLALPGLPTSLRRLRPHLRELALNAGSPPQRRERAGRYGQAQLEYHVSILPDATRVALAARGSEQVCATRAGTDPRISTHGAVIAIADAGDDCGRKPLRTLSNADPAAVLSANQSAPLVIPVLSPKALAKSELLMLLADYRRAANLRLVDACFQFAAAYKAGLIACSESTRAIHKRIGGSTLVRWMRHQTREGSARLNDRRGQHRRGVGYIERTAEIRDWLSAQITAHAARPVGAPRYFQAALAEFGALAPSLAQIKRFIRDFRSAHRVELDWITSPDAARSKYGAAFGDFSSGVTGYLQIVELDGSPADVMTLSGRRRLIAMVDVFTRKAWVIVAPSESTDATGRLFVKLLTARDGGVPALVRTDNGSGFCSTRLRSFASDLGIEIANVAPYRGDLKPFVESMIREIQRICAMLPGYAGRSVQMRERLRGRLTMAQRRGLSEQEILQVSMTDEELEARLDHWLSKVYANTPHSGLNGVTPNQMLARWIESGGEVRRIADEVALSGLLSDGGVRRVGKKGVEMDSATFCAPELGGWIGKDVWAARHADLGKLVIYSLTEPREFLCVAIASERLGIDRREVAIAAKIVQRSVVKNVRRSARQMLGSHTPLHQAIADAAQLAPGIDAPAVDYQTPALAASRAAMDAIDAQMRPAVAHLDEEAIARGREVSARIIERNNQIVDERAEADADWARYCALRAEGEHQIADDDRAWMRSYETSSEARSRLFMEKSFGRTAAG